MIKKRESSSIWLMNWIHSRQQQVVQVFALRGRERAKKRLTEWIPNMYRDNNVFFLGFVFGLKTVRRTDGHIDKWTDTLWVVLLCVVLYCTETTTTISAQCNTSATNECINDIYFSFRFRFSLWWEFYFKFSFFRLVYHLWFTCWLVGWLPGPVVSLVFLIVVDEFQV